MSSQSRGFKSIFIFVVAALLILTWTLPAFAAPGQPGAPSGFRALSGEAARAYQTPGDMQKVDSAASAGGGQVERYQQFVGQAAVLGGQVTIYKDALGTPEAVIGAHYPGLSATNKLALNSGQAQALAARLPGSPAGGEWFARLMIDPASGRQFYQVETRGFDFRWFYWVDAENGALLNSYNGLTDGSGTGVLGDTKDLTGLTTWSSTAYQLVSSGGRQKTYDARNRTRLPGTLATDADDQWILAGRTSPGQRALVDAHFYASVTDNFYLQRHVFDWLAHYSQGMVSSAHVGSNYVNAYWNGTQMAYGDGDGTTFLELSGELDVVAHELSHGVTEATSNLIYQNESGALNEAFSDIMGTSAEYFYGTGNWSIGEDIDIYDADGDGIRSMSDPTIFGDPSHYADRYTGTSDNGGVHTNSGIANHWFYLLVVGGQNADPDRATGVNVFGIGLDAAESIAYKGFTGLTTDATFCAARAATIAVAGGSAANVADAWDEVGVDALLCGGGGGGTLQVSVSTDKASYALKETVRITVTVLNDSGGAVSASNVTVKILNPSGSVVATLSGTTDAAGHAAFSYTTKRTSPKGTYTATATATKTGYTSGAGSITFLVQ